MPRLQRELDSSLWSPIDLPTRREIVASFWDYKNVDGDSVMEPFFHYYTAQIILMCHTEGRYISARTHRDIINITNYLKQGMSRDEIKQQLSSVTLPSNLRDPDEAVGRSVDLAGRLLVMVALGHVPQGFSGPTGLPWNPSNSLQQRVTDCFNPIQAFQAERVRLEKGFIAVNLYRIARITLVWTDNLADHLRMFEHDTKVAIFHHASFLEIVRDSNLFPDAFVEETLRSLALLFPHCDSDTRKWYKAQVKKVFPHQDLDLALLQCGHLRAEDRHIDNFKFWRDRVVILKQVFDESEPKSWAQWWYDRRSGIHRYPLMIAALALVLTAFFGLIQCIEGGIQAYKAWHPS